MKPEAIVRTCVRRGIGCIAITDHNRLCAAQELQRLAPFTVIAGEEIKTTHGEIIGLFLQDEIARGQSPERTIEEIKAQGGLVYVPHPFDRVRNGAIEPDVLPEIIDQVDVIEVLNSRTTFPEDQRMADRFALEHGKLRGAGSDAHVSWELGGSYVEMPEFQGAEEFKRALAAGTIHGNLAGPMAHIASTLIRLRKKYRARLLRRG